jgi:hypothetical protein
MEVSRVADRDLSYQNRWSHYIINFRYTETFRYIGIAEKVIPTYRYWIQYQYFRYTEQPYKAEF